jgi:acyl-CoA thioester hydrolase
VTAAPPLAVFRRTRQVVARDVDLLGHVNNVVWVRFVVELAEAHAAALGLDFHTMRRDGGIWIVRRHDVLYHANVPLGATIHEATWVSSMRAALSRRHARFEGEAGQTLVEASTEWAYVDARTLRPRRIPAAVRERFELVEALGEGTGLTRKRGASSG